MNDEDWLLNAKTARVALRRLFGAMDHVAELATEMSEYAREKKLCGMERRAYSLGAYAQLAKENALKAILPSNHKSGGGHAVR